MIKDIGIIKEINEDNFISDGLMYIINNGQTDEKISLQSSLLSLSFENRVNQIINNRNENDVFKSPDVRNEEIRDFFTKNELRDTDVIFFPDYGLRGVDKIITSENSILYFSFAPRIKMGFFINKVMAEILFAEVQDVYKD